MLKKLLLLAMAFPAMAHAVENPYAGPTMPRFDFSTDATPIPVVHEMLKTMAKVGPEDFVIDLGCGDGRIPITAARAYGARGLGVDLNAAILAKAKENAKKSGVEDRVEFLEQDVFKTDVTSATVVTMAIWPTVHVKLRPILLSQLAPGTRLVTGVYHMGDWKADKKKVVPIRTKDGIDRWAIYMWIVPAQIGGDWKMNIDEHRADFSIQQKYQDFSGSGTVNGQTQRVRNGKIEGTRVTFDFAIDGKSRRYVGHVQPNGEIKGYGWSATRVQ